MNRFLRPLLPWLAASVLATTLGAKPAAPSGPQYFFNINLDPRYQIVGSGPLTPEQATTANCYCFTYGKDGRLQRIEFDRAGTPMEDPFFRAARIDFDYAPGIEHRWYRDAAGQPKTNLYGVDGEELTLGPSGYPVAVTNLNDSGGTMRDEAGVVRFDRTLDGQSRLVRGRRTGLLGIYIQDNDGFFETRTLYDSQGRPIEYDNDDASGKPLENKEGVASTHTAYAVLPEGSQVTESYFDADGQPAEEKSTGIHERRSLYDPRGFKLSVSNFDVNEVATVDGDSGVHERRAVYDDRGNLASEEFFGTDGQPKNNRTLGFARVIYRYDDKNRVISKSYVGDDGLPQVVTSIGAAEIRQEYDAQGNIVRRQFFDGQGNPSNHAIYNVPAIRIQVDGDTTTVSLRDAHDRPARNPVNGYASFSYKTTTDRQLTRHNQYYDLAGRRLSALDVFVIRPHIYKLRHNTGMRRKAHWGIVAALIGALLAMGLAMRKTWFTKRRRIYVPSPFERFLGWFAVFSLVEGTICFFITIYWAWVDYQNGNMSWYVYALNGVVILFFAYRLPRMRMTMRVLNISREGIHQLVRDFYAKAQLKPDYVEKRALYRTDPFSVRISYFANKAHAYLKLGYRHRKGRDLMRGFAQYVRQQVPAMEAPLRTRAIALYYPCVAIAYFILAAMAFYIFVTMVTNI
jgi:YD repeat-containing protein